LTYVLTDPATITVTYETVRGTAGMPDSDSVVKGIADSTHRERPTGASGPTTDVE